ncbi:Rha family transcriptional regulator [Polaromonas sp.]|uniref:Rha family transcriptional regulator n=1 Tax=Polaromonas sp. TaxID=1869339 RepID=UPI00272EF902|nr:Rha family transcriptional regulator [Polaromonas sp.]MDP1742929.1 Rha family transcriptional regulator [Polaromonas sp.]
MTDTTHGVKPTSAQPCELTLTTTKTETRVDTRLMAMHLGNQHRHVMALIEKYAKSFVAFGKVLFQRASSLDSATGQRERFALLNEDQAFFLLSLSRNSDRVVDLKVKLIQAFSEARRAADQRQGEYLPTYHQLHDVIHSLACESSNEKFVHMNVNKLVNKAAGVEAGQRAALALPQQSLLIVAQAVAANALRGAADHHAGYERVKQSLQALAAVTQLEHRP